MEERRCLNCFYAKKIFAMNDCVCGLFGIVDKDHVCEKHQYDMFKAPKPKKRIAKEYSEEKFKL